MHQPVAQGRDDATPYIEEQKDARSEAFAKKPRDRRAEGQGADRIHQGVGPSTVQQHGGEQPAPTAVLQVDRRKGHAGAHVGQLALKEEQHRHGQGDHDHRQRRVEYSL